MDDVRSESHQRWEKSRVPGVPGTRRTVRRVGAEGRTRTGTGYPTRPSNVRVYQFRHFGIEEHSSMRRRTRRTARPGAARRRRGRRRLRRAPAARAPRAFRSAPRPDRRAPWRAPRRPSITDEPLRRPCMMAIDERRQDEDDERADGQLVEQRRRAARAEGRLRRATAEDREIRALALLEQDDEDQEDTDETWRSTADRSRFRPPGSRHGGAATRTRRAPLAGSSE